jgi:hypothetical protein
MSNIFRMYIWSNFFLILPSLNFYVCFHDLISPWFHVIFCCIPVFIVLFTDFWTLCILHICIFSSFQQLLYDLMNRCLWLSLITIVSPCFEFHLTVSVIHDQPWSENSICLDERKRPHSCNFYSVYHCIQFYYFIWSLISYCF